MVGTLVQNAKNDCSLRTALVWLVRWFRIRRITIVVYRRYTTNNDCSLQMHLYGWYVGSECEE